MQTLTGRESYVCVCAGGKIIAEQTHPFVGVKAALTSGGRVFESYAEHIPNKRIIHSCIVDGIRYDLMSAKQGLSCTVFDIENGTFFQKKHFGEIVIQ